MYIMSHNREPLSTGIVSIMTPTKMTLNLMILGTMTLNITTFIMTVNY
jgi:hypothetical protein